MYINDKTNTKYQFYIHTYDIIELQFEKAHTLFSRVLSIKKQHYDEQKIIFLALNPRLKMFSQITVSREATLVVVQSKT